MATAPTNGRLRRLIPKPKWRVRAGLVVAIAIGLIVFFAVQLGGGGPKVTKPPMATTLSGIGPTAISPAGLSALSTAIGRPIYWVGPQRGVTYELKETASGNTYLRYLPPKVRVGGKRLLLTVGTYRVTNAYSVTKSAAAERGAVRVAAGLAIAFYRRSKPESVYVAYPQGDYQVEVFSPNPAQAHRLVANRDLRPIPSSPSAPALVAGLPLAVSVADLKELSAKLGRPIYWIGPRPNTTYELTEKGTSLFLRYLPAGVNVGTHASELTIGTYKLLNAFQITATAINRPDAKRVPTRSNAVAFYRPSRPQSVYLAFPGKNLQIEIYDPSVKRALRLASSGQLRSVG